jgi:hypothetical protein
MKTQKTRKTKQASVPCNIGQAIPIKAVNQIFVESLPKCSDSQNEHLSAFLTVAERVMSILPTFSIHDILSNSLALEIPPHEVTKLFEGWSQTMVEMCKLEKVNGCYGFPVYVRI